MLGGVCLNTGTIPSKTLREAVLYLTGLDQREMYGQSYQVKDEITIADLTAQDAARGRPGERRRAQPADPQRGHDPGRHGRFTGPNTVRDRRRRQPQPRGHRQGHRDRDRHHARPAGHRGVRREDDHRLRRRPAPGPRPPVDARGRRRGDRHRVRVDVRRPGHQGDGRRTARPDAGVLRPRGRGGAEVPPARPGCDVPVRRDRHVGRGASRRRDRVAGQREADPGGDGPVFRRPAGRPTSSTWKPPAWPRTSAAGSWWTSSSAPRSRTSTRSAT